MYPFGTLPQNLIAFCAFLREQHGFRLGPGEIHDAARALEIVDVTDEHQVRNALRPVLSGTFRDVTMFDRAFTEFFFSRPPGIPQPNLPRTRDDGDPDASGAGPLDLNEDDAAEGTRAIRSSYSPLDVDTRESPELTTVDPEWRDAARVLVRRLHLGLTRRWRPSAKGRRFDLRRALRASLQTGGEALAPRWLRRPRRTPRFVLLVDGSRSMSLYAQAALQLGVAIATSTMRLEVFTFSTALRRVTDDVRRAAAGETRRLDRLHHAWAGGTSIGPCLADFLRRFGERLVTRDTVVMIASDGLDIAAPDRLRDAMRDLHRRSAAIVWLNPLLDTPGYEPAARGMAAARPYIGTFASVNDASALARLARIVRVRP
jgi:hypothetical protein